MVGLSITELDASEGLEPIAIIGMGEIAIPSGPSNAQFPDISPTGCRWPGDSESLPELWESLEAKIDAYSKFPKERINADAFYHPNSDRPGSFKTEGDCFSNQM